HRRRWPARIRRSLRPPAIPPRRRRAPSETPISRSVSSILLAREARSISKDTPRPALGLAARGASKRRDPHGTAQQLSRRRFLSRPRRLVAPCPSRRSLRTARCVGLLSPPCPWSA